MRSKEKEMRAGRPYTSANRVNCTKGGNKLPYGPTGAPTSLGLGCSIASLRLARLMLGIQS